MNKIIGLLVKASKNLYGKKEKHIRWVIITIKSLFHLTHQRCSHLTKKNRPWYQVCSNGVDNDNIDQCANAINQQNNVDPSMKRLKKKLRKNVGLLPQNMKIGISHNGHKNISNDIMWYSLLLTMGTTKKKVDPHEV
jgi:hypothetical protein